MNDNKKFSIMKNGYNRYEVDEELKQLNDSLVDAHVQVDRYQKLAEQAN